MSINFKNHSEPSTPEVGRTEIWVDPITKKMLGKDDTGLITNYSSPLGDTLHNDLNTIQGGSVTERYHLTLAEHTYLTGGAIGEKYTETVGGQAVGFNADTTIKWNNRLWSTPSALNMLNGGTGVITFPYAGLWRITAAISGTPSAIVAINRIFDMTLVQSGSISDTVRIAHHVAQTTTVHIMELIGSCLIKTAANDTAILQMRSSMTAATFNLDLATPSKNYITIELIK